MTERPAPAPRPRPIGSRVASTVALGCALAAAGAFVAANDVVTAVAATLLHAVAVALAARAAIGAGGDRSEAVLLAAATAALPGVGAGVAAWFCWSRGERHGSNAHAENDPLRQSTVVGAADLQRELAVNSYTQVVRHGSLEEKRNLLRRLAQLGTPRHVAIVRQFLFEDEPELRLCAYAELARIGHRHEHRIGELRRGAEADLDDAAKAIALATLAAAHRAYSVSGVLDEEMARYWADQGEVIAQRALAHDRDCRAAQRALVQLLADRGALDDAWQVVAAWPAAVDAEDEIARAEVAFRRRDRSTCRAAMQRLGDAGATAPEWLRSVTLAEATP